jgi:hypothetical protein
MARGLDKYERSNVVCALWQRQISTNCFKSEEISGRILRNVILSVCTRETECCLLVHVLQFATIFIAQVQVHASVVKGVSKAHLHGIG